MVYYKRWTIEKAFNNSKSDLVEREAWSSNLNALNSQMRFTSMHIILCAFLKKYQKAKNPECIHPSDKKYDEALDKRQKAARGKGDLLTHYFFMSELRAYAHSPFKCNYDR